MNIKKIEPEDFSSFQKEIEKIRNEIDRTINLTWFYIHARFGLELKEFQESFSVDGRNDGGIDCYFKEGNTFYVIQSKFHIRSQKESVDSINHELQKIEKTIIGENTNHKAEDFINDLRRQLKNQSCYLEIIWLTTNEVTENTRKESQEYLDKILERGNWDICAEVNFIDRFALEGVIYDIKHGYVPHTGKKVLKIEDKEYMTIGKNGNNIEAVVCNVRAIEILKWFEKSDEINTFLQKNVRESIGDKSVINKAIRKSYKEDPGLFWYKHNGVIVFADWLELNDHDAIITMRNPQIVNGGQTVTQLFKAYNEDRSIHNSAKLLIRIYRLPYEDSETYKRSIDIISALNSQNKIKSSDLHSTDPRQVMLENRINELGERFTYTRKRSDKSKIASPTNIIMTKLALIYHTCTFEKPDEGIAYEIESYFEEDKKYNNAFPESLIKKPIDKGVNHIVFNYIDCWKLYFIIDRWFSYELNNKQTQFYEFVFWYVLVDAYVQLQRWKEQKFNGTWREWIEFIESNEIIKGMIKYCLPQYNKYMKMLPKNEVDPRSFYKSVDGRTKFLKNKGNPSTFNNEMKNVYQLFRKRNGYENL